MARTTRRGAGGDRTLVESRLAYHLRCLRAHATQPELPALERLTLVRERVARIRAVRQELAGT